MVRPKQRRNRRYKRFVLAVKGNGIPRNPDENYDFEGHARRSFREWVEQGNKYHNVSYIQLWDLGDGVEDPIVIKERKWNV